MVTKKQIKLVRSLQQKKYRNEYGLFVVEGLKLTTELLGSHFKKVMVFISDANLADNFDTEVALVTPNELKQMSSLQTPSGVLGVFEIPKTQVDQQTDWVVVLDAVRDPGNLGTIVRLCDWYGISQLVCSMDTVDCYNPKVLQATMGSIARVHICYQDLIPYLEGCQKPIFGAFMDGVSVVQQKLPEKGVLIMGNEASGISAAIAPYINQRVAIPQYGGPTTESLNVATATAVLLNEIRRDSFTQK